MSPRFRLPVLRMCVQARHETRAGRATSRSCQCSPFSILLTSISTAAARLLPEYARYIRCEDPSLQTATFMPTDGTDQSQAMLFCQMIYKLSLNLKSWATFLQACKRDKQSYWNVCFQITSGKLALGSPSCTCV